MALGMIVLFMPIFAGEWVIAFLGIALITAELRFSLHTNKQGENDSGFNEIHLTLKRFTVDLAMAGDTHDFEFYKEKYTLEGKQIAPLHA